jgi:hypothetical protein
MPPHADVNLSKDLTEQYKEKMRQTHNAEDLESAYDGIRIAFKVDS